MKWGPGKLLYIHIASASAETMQELSVAELIKNKGIRGDRYFKGNGKYSNIPDIREVTIIEKEVLDALEQNQPPLQEKSIILKGGRLNFPCKYLADLLNKPLLLPLYNRSGLNCKIIKSGIIRQNDIIEPYEG